MTIPFVRAIARLLLVGAAGGLVGCATATPGPSAPVQAAPAARMAMVRDAHSFAQPAEARVTHVDLDLAADFGAQRLAGTAALDIAVAHDARRIVLDTKALDIAAVTDATGRPLRWSLGPADPVLGRPLTVALPRAGVQRIVVRYATSADAGALQWLAPAQTAGKRHPFLFSQGQAILTRSWIPTQDSPGIRQTYTARIVVPAPLTALMSAAMLTPHGERVPGGRAFRFRLDQPIPPYLIALAIGDLAFRPLGARTGVWAEPATVARAAAEFVDIERMVEAAEALYGRYRWGRYDVLVLPPSFPFGGMENPRLTFATPTVIAGDRSLVSLIAHELAHSWSGNLVTNATWDDFWLNEGFTTYFENRIMEALYGRERAAMLARLGWQDLERAIADLGGPSAPDTRLRLDLKGRDPDAGMNDIAYEKGANFLRTIEAAVGRARFDAWLRGYFERHAFRPMTTDGFVADLRAHLIKRDAALERRLMLERWIDGPGIPGNVAVPRSEALATVDAQVRAFADGAPAARLDTHGWTTQHWQHFLTTLPRALSSERLADLDRHFNLSAQGNSEILFGWLQLAVFNRYAPAVPALERFLESQGRRKFVQPLFAALVARGEWGRLLAQRIYARTRPLYHPVTASSVDALFKS